MAPHIFSVSYHDQSTLRQKSGRLKSRFYDFSRSFLKVLQIVANARSLLMTQNCDFHFSSNSNEQDLGSVLLVAKYRLKSYSVHQNPGRTFIMNLKGKYLVSVFLISILSVMSCTHKQTQMTGAAEKRFPGSADSKALIRYDYADGEITSICNKEIKSMQSKLDLWRDANAVGARSPQALLDFEELTANFSDAMGPILFMGSVSTSSKLRDEASACEESVGVFQNGIFTNREYYNRLKEIQTKDPAQSRLLHEALVAFEFNGMKLNDEDLKKYKALADRLTQLTTQFGQNLNNDISTVTFTEKELAGVKPDFLARLKKDDKGQFIVTTKSPDYIHVMENASQGETRKKMMFAYNNRQAEKNTALLEEAVQVRAQIGKLMGYPTYADFALTQKMASKSKTVWDFLKGLRIKLSDKNKSDLKILAAFKRKELKDSSPLNPWDVSYVSNQMKIQKYKVDQDLISEYFPAQSVIDYTFEVYSKLLGVDFKEVKEAPVWATQVKLFEVIDRSTKQVIAHFYTDLVPREGKYGHAAAFPLISGRVLKSDGHYQKPVASIVANFTPPSENKPSLLTHDEIETFFHEFGHIMHQVLTKAPYASLSGTNVKQDFVEAPSQMLENWVWEKSVLQKMSQHYKDPSKKIPTDLIARMRKLRLMNAGIQNTRQLVFGLFDMEIHTNDKSDVTAVYAKLQKDLTGFQPLEGTHFPATFGHMMGGYAAGYYGYLWSKVYAEDMFSEFAKKGILNAELGKKYRKEILEKGNMSDPLVLVKKFLGREPNNKAFFKSLGL